MDNYADEADYYPAGDPIPDPDGFDARYETLIDFLTTSGAMRKAATSSFKQSLWAGSAAMAGGMVLGPVGGLVGGITGSIIGYATAPNYDGVLTQLGELCPASKHELLAKVGTVLMAAAGGAGATITYGFPTSRELREALVRFASDSSVRDGVWDACLESLQT